ncbi:unnamed protein product [Effrenium voratum]|nr:unnamed protein product [Effrenium voratum]
MVHVTFASCGFRQDVRRLGEQGEDHLSAVPRPGPLDLRVQKREHLPGPSQRQPAAEAEEVQTGLPRRRGAPDVPFNAFLGDDRLRFGQRKEAAAQPEKKQKTEKDEKEKKEKKKKKKESSSSSSDSSDSSSSS